MVYYGILYCDARASPGVCVPWGSFWLRRVLQFLRHLPYPTMMKLLLLAICPALLVHSAKAPGSTKYAHDAAADDVAAM